MLLQDDSDRRNHRGGNWTKCEAIRFVVKSQNERCHDSLEQIPYSFQVECPTPGITRRAHNETGIQAVG